MSTTTAADLLERADLLTRDLRGTGATVSQAQWAAFDHTIHRLLTEVLGANASWLPATGAARTTLRQVLHDYPSLGEHPTGPVATDEHPLCRLTTTLGVLADLMHQPEDARYTILRQETELADVTARVLAIAAVAAHYTLAHSPLEVGQQPLTMGGFAEHMLDQLSAVDVAQHGPGLRLIAATTPAGTPGGLDQVLAEWDTAVDTELQVAVPSAEVFRSLAVHATHVYGVSAYLVHRTSPEVPLTPLQATVVQLAQVNANWVTGLTTLTPPTHRFVTASRGMYETLRHIDHDARTGDLDAETVLVSLTRTAHAFTRHLSAVERLPVRLINSHLLLAPSRNLPATADRVVARLKGRLAAVQHEDVIDLLTAWRGGITAARTATATIDAALAANPRLGSQPLPREAIGIG